MSFLDTLRYPRLIRLSFYTTSIEKLLQARIIFSKRGYNLQFSRSLREPYEEDYSSDTSFLLKRAISYIDENSFLRGAYIIEDTSLRLDALSGRHDFPGMQVKEWFSRTTFDALDQELRENLNNRRAIVKSDIALKLPTLSEPILFHGETEGTVAETPARFNQSPMYPWLSPNNFNGWFVPDGQRGTPKRLGEMEFEESLIYDFRARSLNALLDEYDRLNAAANIPSSYISARSELRKESSQLELGLSNSPPIICVIGYKCAGKTTFAHITQSTRDVIHLEASDFFRIRAEESGIKISSDVDALDYMDSAGYDVVTRTMVEHIDNLSGNFIVITGLRTPEELSLLKILYPSLLVVGITADDRTRYERHLRRARDAYPNNFPRFSEADRLHNTFGLVSLMSEVCDYVINNDGTLDDYKRRVSDLISSLDRPGIPRDTGRHPSELSRSLRALALFSEPATCDEIANRTYLSDDGLPMIRKYNVNRALKTVPVFAERIERKGTLLSYRATRRLAAVLNIIP